MATKDARGTKRTCQSEECGSRFYDLNRDPITCPICGSIYELPHAPPGAVIEDKPVKEARTPKKDDVNDSADGDADETDEADELEDIDTGEDIADDADDSDTFLEEEEEDGGNVKDIIGGPRPEGGEET